MFFGKEKAPAAASSELPERLTNEKRRPKVVGVLLSIYAKPSTWS